MGNTVYPRPKKLDKLTREEKLALMFDLINAFTLVKNPVETAFLIQDLLTANEIRNLAMRLRIAKLLLRGKKQREIQEEIHASFATITKISLWLEQGSNGLRKTVSKLPTRYKLPKRLPPGPIEYHLPQALTALVQYGLAKRQGRQLEGFLEGVEGKAVLDKSLREAFNDFYRKKK